MGWLKLPFSYVAVHVMHVKKEQSFGHPIMHTILYAVALQMFLAVWSAMCPHLPHLE